MIKLSKMFLIFLTVRIISINSASPSAVRTILATYPISFDWDDVGNFFLMNLYIEKTNQMHLCIFSASNLSVQKCVVETPLYKFTMNNKSITQEYGFIKSIDWRGNNIFYEISVNDINGLIYHVKLRNWHLSKFKEIKSEDYLLRGGKPTWDNNTASLYFTQSENNYSYPEIKSINERNLQTITKNATDPIVFDCCIYYTKVNENNGFSEGVFRYNKENKTNEMLTQKFDRNLSMANNGTLCFVRFQEEGYSLYYSIVLFDVSRKIIRKEIMDVYTENSELIDAKISTNGKYIGIIDIDYTKYDTGKETAQHYRLRIIPL